MRRNLRVPFYSSAALIAPGGTATPLWAHAVLMESKPKVNSTVKGPDVPIWLRFNVRVDGKRSRLQLVAPDGSTHCRPDALSRRLLTFWSPTSPV